MLAVRKDTNHLPSCRSEHKTDTVPYGMSSLKVNSSNATLYVFLFRFWLSFELWMQWWLVHGMQSNSNIIPYTFSNIVCVGESFHDSDDLWMGTSSMNFQEVVAIVQENVFTSSLYSR